MTASHDTHIPQITARVLRITVAASAKGGSLDLERISASEEALRTATHEPSKVGCVLLVGTGRNFCVGGNVRAMASTAEPGVLVHAMAEAFHRFVRALDALPVPVVAAVQGWAAGAGMSIACAADVAVGGPSTRFRPAYPALAFTPDGGLSWTLPRIVGQRRARSILLTDQVIDAREAMRLGLITCLVPDEAISEEAGRIASQLANGPRSALRASKHLLARSSAATLSEQLDAETAAIAACATSRDGLEGVAAFVEGRVPAFSRDEES